MMIPSRTSQPTFKRPMGFFLLAFLALFLGACSNAIPEAPTASAPTATLAPVQATTAPVSTSTPAMSQAIEPLPEGLALLERLVLDKPIVIGIADDSAQTAAIVIPTMF